MRAPSKSAAANTITIAPDGRTTGFNFDRSPLAQQLRCRVNAWPGAAHSARPWCRSAAATALTAPCASGCASSLDLGISIALSFTILTRTRAAALKADLEKHRATVRCRISDDLLADIAAADGRCCQRHPDRHARLSRQILVPVEALQSRHWAADVIYTPLQTEYLEGSFGQRRSHAQWQRDVRASGARCVSAQITGVHAGSRGASIVRSPPPLLRDDALAADLKTRIVKARSFCMTVGRKSSKMRHSVQGRGPPLMSGH